MGAGRGADGHARLEMAIEEANLGAERTLSLKMPVLAPDGAVTLQDRTIAVNVPKGVAQGQHIRLAGKGTPGAGSAGDPFLEVAFAPHAVYRPEGRDPYLELSASPWEAALGGNVVTPTPGGEVDLCIPKNAREGKGPARSAGGQHLCDPENRQSKGRHN